MRIVTINLILILGVNSCGKDLEHVKFNIYRNTTDSTLVYETYADDFGKVYYPIPNKLNVETAIDFNEWLIDDKTIFAWFNTSDGRILIELEVADRETFTVLDNSIYAKDKNNVYDSRHGILKMADLESFEVIYITVENKVAFARDKDNYFFWDEIVTDTSGFAEAYQKWTHGKRKPNNRFQATPNCLSDTSVQLHRDICR